MSKFKFSSIAHWFGYNAYEFSLFNTVKKGHIPQHIAIIMDGNRRYASKAKKIVDYGHKQGASVTEQVIEWCYDLNVKQLTVYAFSTENFNRPSDEKEKLFELIGLKFDEIASDERTHKRKMRIRAIGDIEKLPNYLQKSVYDAEMITEKYNNFYLNVALAYGGRQDIIQAVKKIAQEVEKNYIDPKEVNEVTISKYLYPEGGNPIPNVDLIIRSGGDERLSNFLPWQTSGNECGTYFCSPYWPDFRKIDLLRAIRLYQERLDNKTSIVSKRNAILKKIHGK